MKMKKQLDIKKLLLLNMPYILMGLFATNFGEGWRMAVGADASAKMLSFFSTLPVALASWWPSLHPLDLLVGLCCGAGLRLAVYLKSKNAKKYRHGMEYGSARWGTHEDIAPYIDPVFQNNVILTKTESLTMNSRPKDPKTAFGCFGRLDMVIRSVIVMGMLLKKSLSMYGAMSAGVPQRALPYSIPWRYFFAFFPFM